MLLDLGNIRKSFGGVQAVQDGNLAVRPGEVHLLLGENGAGKSTRRKSTRLNSSHIQKSRMPSSA